MNLACKKLGNKQTLNQDTFVVFARLRLKLRVSTMLAKYSATASHPSRGNYNVNELNLGNGVYYCL